MDTTNLNMLWSSLLVEELSRQGIHYYCFSPGSRLVPLAIAIGRHPATRALIAYDERAAAFHALGYARATGRPAVLVCTSGSAAAHYFPAVVEAAQDAVPMLILTTDLPPDQRDCGANQSIDQNGIYGDYVRWSFDFPCPEGRIKPTMVLATIDQALYRSLHPDPGPVHLNLSFREPLVPVPMELPAGYLDALRPWLERKEPLSQVFTGNSGGLDDAQLKVLETAVAAARRGLLVVGRLRDDRERDATLKLANALRWPVFADILSGLRLDSRLETQISYCDQLLHAPAFAESCRPDTVLHLGGSSVSGDLLKHLAAHPPREYIRLLSRSGREDPYHQVSLRFQGDLETVCRQLSRRILPAGETDWLRGLRASARQAETLYAGELDTPEALSEPGLARLLVRLLDGEQVLLLGNSLPVREVDGFAAPCRPAPPVVGNRGASGIDGTIATASGYAVGAGRPVVVLCGDLTLFHDLTSLHLLGQIDRPVTVVVINNSGGGAFSFLPVAKYPDVFETWFGTPHSLCFESAANLFGLDYHAPSTRAGFVEAWRSCRRQGRPALIEVATERSATASCQRQLQRELADRLGAESLRKEEAATFGSGSR
jgi:2-succinyl-5-enolpyruvyl-6-hydroxy-3-cyclohexene-1-carboxylate synthase